MAREHFAADGNLLMGQRGEARFRIAPFDYLELLERLLGVALVLVGTADLIVMRHRQVVRRQLDLLAGRMHLLEVAQRRDRLAVVFLLALGKPDPAPPALRARPQRPPPPPPLPPHPPPPVPPPARAP